MNTHNTKRQLSAACRYSYSRMALNHYTLYEAMYDETGVSGELEGYAGELHQVLQAFLTGDGDMERLHRLRLQMTAAIEVLIARTDYFQVCECVLDRMEYRFGDDVAMDSDVGEFTLRLMEYLVTSRGTVTVNERIQQVIGQLPVRYIKQKFFKLLRGGLSVYIDSEEKGLENMMYIPRAESMAKLSEQMEQEHKDLYEILEALRQADYLHMEKEKYRKCVDRIIYVSDKLFQEASNYILLQGLVNDSYVLHLAALSAMVGLSERQALEKIVGSVLNQFLEGNTSMINEAVTDMLWGLEGKQKGAVERYLSYPAPDEVKDDEVSHTLRKADRLLSGNPFVSLDKTVEEDLSGTVDREWLDSHLGTSCGELNQLFAGISKPTVQAIIAKLLSSLPMVFQSTDGLSDYIMKNLTSCSGTAGRETTTELLNQEMVSEDALV